MVCDLNVIMDDLSAEMFVDVGAGRNTCWNHRSTAAHAMSPISIAMYYARRRVHSMSNLATTRSNSFSVCWQKVRIVQLLVVAADASQLFCGTHHETFGRLVTEAARAEESVQRSNAQFSVLLPPFPCCKR